MSQSNTEAPSAQDTLELRDTRTDKTYNATIRTEGPEGDTYVRAMDLRAVKREPGEFGLLSYDPAFMNTASCRSAITFIDGDKGILRYRGYPIEQLAENATFLRWRTCCATGSCRIRGSTTRGCTTSRTTPTCTRISASSWKGSGTTRTPCR